MTNHLFGLHPDTLKHHKQVTFDQIRLVPLDQPVKETMKFDSYMIHEAELNLGDFRLLKTDRPLFLPGNTHIRLLITSSDVLHS
jgi:heme/copper-type cytochrome/quinol oxidase subunit 2